MEYLSGKTLKQVIRDEGPLPLARVVDITRQVGDALNAAHEQGVVHRDLKSDNIMLVDTMAGDHAKVLDFGIAKINEPEGSVDTNLTAPNLVIGTPQYMSPEQCSQDVEIDARSDIYSLGVILLRDAGRSRAVFRRFADDGDDEALAGAGAISRGGAIGRARIGGSRRCARDG